MAGINIWQAVLGEIEVSISRGSFVTWFKQTRLVRADDEGYVIVGVANIFAKQQLEVKYSQIIRETLLKHGVDAKRIDFKIVSDTHTEEKTAQPAVGDSTSLSDTPRVIDEFQQTPSHLQVTAKPQYQSSSQPDQTPHFYQQGLNSRYTFDNFIVGSSNELAYAAGQAVANNPGTKYNPLFIYGGVGIGKTHLLQAIGNGIIANRGSAKVVYVTSEQFVQDFLDAIRYKKIGAFTNHYRNTDVLIVDDMQFIAGKEKTQEEFFHTFNTLHQANKQIILSSDRPPKSIPTLEDRLRTRFEWGMAVDMQSPDFETRCAIIQTKATSQELTLSPDLVEFLANYAQNNVRELEGALNQLLAYCEMRNFRPDLQVAQGLFGSKMARPRHVSAKQIIERTAKYFSVPMEDILGPKRDKDIVMPRQIAMFFLRSELHLSFPKIARELGRKDHTTAIHSIDKISADLAINSELKQQIEEIKERLYV